MQHDKPVVGVFLCGGGLAGCMPDGTKAPETSTVFPAGTCCEYLIRCHAGKSIGAFFAGGRAKSLFLNAGAGSAGWGRQHEKWGILLRAGLS